MALAPRLDIRQSQSLVMTPQLQQAIRLLALSNLELEAAIAEEMANNPLLADAGEGSEAPAPMASDAAQSTDRLLEAGVSAAGDTLDVDLAADTFHHDTGSDALWEGAHSGQGDGEGFDFDSIGAGSLSLREHLLAQAGEVLGGPPLAIASALIGSIDEAGYCDADLSELAMRLGVARARVEDTLHIIQTFDPTGVGARDLAECLALQAKEADRYDPCMARLIDNLDLLARGQVAQLKRLCGVDDEDMADMIRELRGYDPKPGLRFASDEATPVVPDVFVRRTVSGWLVEINSATLPRLLVDRRYYVELSSGAGKGAGKAWLQERLASANWLIKALDQRQQTIIKVTREIVQQQEGYFLYGVGALRPLTLRQVADAIGMHESTVSRVTSNKYVHSPRGLNELKYFFSSGVMAADGEGGMSAEAVKSRIRALIEAEDPKAILSDDTLVEMLGKEGCEIARRTVAKYREAMGIGSSVQRRRAKAIGM
jgi:RNA polymerase sigma-54 factor